MQIKNHSFKVKGMNKDLSYSAFNPEYSWDNKNIRLTARYGDQSNDLLAVTNERGTKQISFDIVDRNPITTTIVLDSFALITASSINVYANVSSTAPQVISRRGFCYSISPNPTVDDEFFDVAGYTGAMEHSFSGLTRLSEYYFRAYAYVAGSVIYSNEILFTTIAELPISHVDMSNIIIGVGNDSITTLGIIDNDGGSAILDKGYAYQPYVGGVPVSPVVTVSMGANDSDFDIIVTGLEPGASYQFKTYATNSAGTSYSGPSILSTYLGLVEFTIVADAIYNNKLVTTMIIDAANVPGLIESGICYSTATIEPTIISSAKISGASLNVGVESVLYINDSAYNQTYYVRPYAIDTNGSIYYGTSTSVLSQKYNSISYGPGSDSSSAKIESSYPVKSGITVYIEYGGGGFDYPAWSRSVSLGVNQQSTELYIGDVDPSNGAPISQIYFRYPKFSSYTNPVDAYYEYF